MMTVCMSKGMCERGESLFNQQHYHAKKNKNCVHGIFSSPYMSVYYIIKIELLNLYFFLLCVTLRMRLTISVITISLEHMVLTAPCLGLKQRRILPP